MTVATQPRSALSWALSLTIAGYQVFPCGADKRPLTTGGFHDATDDPDTIRRWWRQNPDSLIGLALPEGTMVVDFDSQKPDFDPAKAEALNLPETLIQQTRSGGYHAFLRVPPGMTVKQGSNVYGPGIDTRVAGKGYVIAYDWEGLYAQRPETWAEAPAQLAYHEPQPSPVAEADEALGTRDQILSFLGTFAARGIRLSADDYYAILTAKRTAGEIVALDERRPWTDRSLRQLAQEAAKWPVEKTGEAILALSEAEAPTDSATDSGTAPTSLSDFLSEQLPVSRWLVDGLIPAGPSLGGLFGQYKAGKSLVGLQLCMMVAAGVEHFLFHDIHPDGEPTIFIEYEGSRRRLQERATLMSAKFSGGRRLPMEIIHRPKEKIDTREGANWLLRACEGKALCVIGPVSKATSMKEENDQHEWAVLADILQKITDRTGCSIILVHHTRKPSQQFGPPNGVEDFFTTVRGSNSFLGAVDFALGVQRPPEETEGVLYFLERDGESGRQAYDFDVPSLCIWPSDRPLGRPTLQDSAERLYSYIEQNPDCTQADISASLAVSRPTVGRWIETLGDRLEASPGKGRAPNTYRVSLT